MKERDLVKERLNQIMWKFPDQEKDLVLKFISSKGFEEISLKDSHFPGKLDNFLNEPRNSNLNLEDYIGQYDAEVLAIKKYVENVQEQEKCKSEISKIDKNLMITQQDQIADLDHYDLKDALFVFEGIVPHNKYLIRGEHTKLIISHDVEAIFFSNKALYQNLYRDKVVTLLGRLDINTYQGRSKKQILIDDYDILEK